MTKRGKKAGIMMFAVTVVLLVLTGCSTVKAAATEEDVRACNLTPGKDVFALGEATILLSNPNLDVMKAAGWKVDDSAVRPMLTDIHDVDLSKDNCVLYRVGSHEPGSPSMAARWFGYCMQWAVQIPYYGGTPWCSPRISETQNGTRRSSPASSTMAARPSGNATR